MELNINDKTDIHGLDSLEKAQLKRTTNNDNVIRRAAKSTNEQVAVGPSIGIFNYGTIKVERGGVIHIKLN